MTDLRPFSLDAIVDLHLADASEPARAFARRQVEIWWLRHGVADRLDVAQRLGLDYDPALDPMPKHDSPVTELRELLLGIGLLDSELRGDGFAEAFAHAKGRVPPDVDID